MNDGFGYGQPRQPHRPSAIVFLLAAIAFLVIFAGVAATVLVNRHQAEQTHGDTVRTAQRRILLAETVTAIALSETAEWGFRETGNAVSRSRYVAARTAIASRLAGLLGLARSGGDTTAGILRLRELVEARFATSDALIEAGATASHPQSGPGPRLPATAIALSRAIDRQGDALFAAENRRLDQNRRRSDRDYDEIGTLFWLISAATIFATILGVGLLWRANSTHYRLEIQAYDALMRLRAVFSGTSDAIIIFTPSGRIEEANTAAASLLGHEIGTLEGRNIASVVDIADIPMERRLAILHGTEPMPMHLDRVARDHAGNAIPVDVAVGLIPFGDGIRIVASLRDVSERRASERMKDDFISTISHELRTPLTSVVGALGLLREGAAGALPDAAARLVDIADNNARRLIRLVNDILDIDQLDSGRIRLDIAALDLRGLASRARDGAEGIAAPRGVRIALAPTDAGIMVLGDPGRLLQVIGNLLSNAIRFSPAGGTVVLAIEVRGREALVRVDDDGPGVPSEFRDRLFGRFNQSEAGAAIPGGTGLGLAISREIVRAHGGEIWYSDRRGGGARFCFSLPLEEHAGVDSPRRLLLCEDDAVTAASLRELIEDDGYVVDRSGSIAEARTMARTGRYDAMILDLTLPDASGLEAVIAVRNQRETRGLPLIVLSGAASVHRVDPRADRLDVVDWIDKPPDYDRLRAALDAALARADDDRPVLLHVEDDADVREVVALALADRGRILQAGSLASARAALVACRPAAVILDLGLPDGSGLDLIHSLAEAPGGAIPTVVYSAGIDMPAIGGPIEATLVKSARSPLVLSEAIRTILLRQADTEAKNG